MTLDEAIATLDANIQRLEVELDQYWSAIAEQQPLLRKFSTEGVLDRAELPRMTKVMEQVYMVTQLRACLFKNQDMRDGFQMLVEKSLQGIPDEWVEPETDEEAL